VIHLKFINNIELFNNRLFPVNSQNTRTISNYGLSPSCTSSRPNRNLGYGVARGSGHFVLRYMQLGQQSVIGDGRINATGSSSYSLDNRRCSLVDLTVSRHARRESVLHQQQENLLESSNCSAGSSAAPRRQPTKLLGEYLEKWSVLPHVSPPRPLDESVRRLAGSLMSSVLFFAPSCLVAGQCHKSCRVAFKLHISSSA